MSDFVHLHVHSEYSLLDGLGSVNALVSRAAELAMPALALTDHGTMYATIDFYREAKRQGIKPIVGIESYLTPVGRRMTDRQPNMDDKRYHQLLLAQNDVGYRNLLKIASAAQLDGFYYKPRIDREFLAGHADGLIATTGCMVGELPRLLAHGNARLARERLGWWIDVFGRDRFFLELQEHGIPELTQVNRQFIEWAREFNLKLIATNDVHYIKSEDAGPHDVLLCVQTGELVTQQDRMRMSDGSYYMKSYPEMLALFKERPDSLHNTLAIAEMCEVDLDPQGYHLPPFDVPPGYDAVSFLRHLVDEGLKQRYGDRASDPEIQARKEHELKIIHNMGFDTYFLIVWDLCEFARRRDIWWNVRGSGAGSLVAYAVGITNLDPLANHLLFERFLNPGRVSMPDIDLDYPDDRREEMINYTVEKYGKENVAQIITFGTMGARAAIRDVGRAMDIPLPEVDRIAKLIPGGPKVQITDGLAQSSELRELYDSQDYVHQLIDTAMRLEGVARHASTHAAGVIIGDKPLIEYTPLHRPTKGDEGGIVTQYSMDVLLDMGLLKIDFLGLSALTIMRQACDLIAARHGVKLDLNTIPINDEKAFALLSSGNVTGVFQVESAGMRRVLTTMKPTKFEHIVATISLYRPGPMEYIDDYIDRMHGRKPVQYHHPALEPILGETYGICVSGDALVADARTGRRYRLDEVKDVPEMLIQGVDENWQLAVGRVTRWIDSGHKPVYRVMLRNGAHVKVTSDHRLLTEAGWRPLSELRVGDYIATPPYLIGPDETEVASVDQGRLRALAYLIADGSLASMAAVDLVSKDAALLKEYQRCLAAFAHVRPSVTEQSRGVTRIGVAKDENSSAHYHTPNALLAWLRELGFKSPPGQTPGGLRSHEKYIPPFVFQLDAGDIAFFLASLWDCDGYLGRKLCHYKTVSRRLAEDVQTLLLRLGVRSTSHEAEYPLARRNGREGGVRHSYQVTVYDTQRLAALIQPHMVTAKKDVSCAGRSATTLDRAAFIAEVDAVTSASRRALMAEYGIDRLHFYVKGRRRPRISARVVAPLAEALPLPETGRCLNLVWEEIVAVEAAGVDHVYDLTVEGLHSFVANNIVVHNCVYQEQIISIARDLAGYDAGEADLMRRAVGKKKKEELLQHREKFVAGAVERNIPEDAANKIFDDIEFFARYGFNKAHAADYAVITCQTAYLKAHYPVEYMTALLTVERNNTDKVGLLIGECRTMGIQVLPPDINKSDIHFTIENADDGPAIRFGLGAVKNVGEGAIEVILRARAVGGPFADVDDFCHRVDLRQVNRRALESLTKVGALRPFGQRAQLLAIIDRMLGLSSQTHQAAAVGQISMFDLGGFDAPTTGSILYPLPEVEEVTRREMLDWEKELVGVYVSEHPMQPFINSLRDTVTCFLGQLDETMAGHKVTVAGMVNWVRQIYTKNGKPMAFVELEDVQGIVELVVFPHVYEGTREMWKEGKVVVVRGQVDTKGGNEPKIICEMVDDAISRTQPATSQGIGNQDLGIREAGIRYQVSENQADANLIPDSPIPDSRSPYHLQITVNRTGNPAQDKERLRTVYKLVTHYQGNDTFSLFIPNGKRRVQLDFPNATTCHCAELQQKLTEMLGATAVRVERQDGE